MIDPVTQVFRPRFVTVSTGVVELDRSRPLHASTWTPEEFAFVAPQDRFIPIPTPGGADSLLEALTGSLGLNDPQAVNNRVAFLATTSKAKVLQQLAHADRADMINHVQSDQ